METLEIRKNPILPSNGDACHPDNPELRKVTYLEIFIFHMLKPEAVAAKGRNPYWEGSETLGLD